MGGKGHLQLQNMVAPLCNEARKKNTGGRIGIDLEEKERESEDG